MSAKAQQITTSEDVAVVVVEDLAKLIVRSERDTGRGRHDRKPC